MAERANNNGRNAAIVLLLLALLLFGTGFGGERPDAGDKDDNDDDDECPPGKVPNPRKGRPGFQGVAPCVPDPNLPPPPDPTGPGGEPDRPDPTGPGDEPDRPGRICAGPGMVPNPLRELKRAELEAAGMTRGQLALALRRYPVCVLELCPDDAERNEFGACVPRQGPPPSTDPTDVDDLIKDYPSPRSFYQVISGDTFTGNDGIATRLARSCLFLAAKKIGGLDDDAARAWASARDTWARQAAVTRAIACVPVNDARFGTYAYTQGTAMPGAQGRAIRLLPINGPDRQRYKTGEPPIRNVRIGKPGDPPSVSQGPIADQYRDFEFLWLPEFDLKQLWDSDGRTWVYGGSWSDGSPTYNPPPALYALGVLSYDDGDPPPWGCAPFTEEIG